MTSCSSSCMWTTTEKELARSNRVEGGEIPFLSEATCFSPLLKEGEKDENLDKTACCFLLLFFLNPILVFCSISETTAFYEAQKEDKEARLEWGGVDGRGKTDYGKRNFIFLLAAVALLGG